MREARLRPEFAHLYPGLNPDQWEPASRVAEAVLANLMLQEMAEISISERILPEEHFEFRGSPPLDGGVRQSYPAGGSGC